jgi:hypothetical protein
MAVPSVPKAELTDEQRKLVMDHLPLVRSLARELTIKLGLLLPELERVGLQALEESSLRPSVQPRSAPRRQAGPAGIAPVPDHRVVDLQAEIEELRRERNQVRQELELARRDGCAARGPPAAPAPLPATPPSPAMNSRRRILGPPGAEPAPTLPASPLGRNIVQQGDVIV